MNDKPKVSGFMCFFFRFWYIILGFPIVALGVPLLVAGRHMP